MRIRRLFLLPELLGAFICIIATPSRAAVVVDFSQEGYLATPGETVLLEVEIAFDPGGPEDLFSYGVRLLPASTNGLTVHSIAVPPELDFRGVFGPGAMIDPDPGVLGAWGTIDVSTTPLVPYTGSLLVTYELSLDSVGDFDFTLDFYRIIGPTENVFVSGDGTPLDTLITFGSTTVRVVPGEDFPPTVFARRLGDNIELRFATIDGVDYTVQWGNDLREWNFLTMFTGDGNEAVVEDVGAALLSVIFYRVLLSAGGGP